MSVAIKNKPPVAGLDAALRRAGFKRGETLEFKVSRKKVTIVPTPPQDPDDVLTPDQAKRLRQSLKQMRQGKTIPWSNVKH